jgi:hypothetical protein
MMRSVVSPLMLFLSGMSRRERLLIALGKAPSFVRLIYLADEAVNVISVDANKVSRLFRRYGGAVCQGGLSQ